MMAQKAALFGDDASYAKIIATHNPKLCKALDRKVKGFDEDVWVDNRERIVYEGNFMKFSQNPALCAALLDTKNTCIVEASPYDKIWGIGMKETHKDAITPSKWRGLNLLGKALMKVREQLRAKNKKQTSRCLSQTGFEFGCFEVNISFFSYLFSSLSFLFLDVSSSSSSLDSSSLIIRVWGSKSPGSTVGSLNPFQNTKRFSFPTSYLNLQPRRSKAHVVSGVTSFFFSITFCGIFCRFPSTVFTTQTDSSSSVS